MTTTYNTHIDSLKKLQSDINNFGSPKEINKELTKNLNLNDVDDCIQCGKKINNSKVDIVVEDELLKQINIIKKEMGKDNDSAFINCSSSGHPICDQIKHILKTGKKEKYQKNLKLCTTYNNGVKDGRVLQSYSCRSLDSARKYGIKDSNFYIQILKDDDTVDTTMPLFRFNYSNYDVHHIHNAMKTIKPKMYV
jgi:hypothetical protein